MSFFIHIVHSFDLQQVSVKKILLIKPEMENKIPNQMLAFLCNVFDFFSFFSSPV
jgi:hypothetical protein